MRIKSIITIAIFSILQAGFQSAEAQGLSLRFLAFPEITSPEPIQLMTGDGEPVNIDTPSHELSRPVNAGKVGEIVIGVTTLNAKQESVFQVLGRAKALPSKRQIVLLFPKGDDYTDGYVVLPVDGDITKFKGGHYMFINASSMNVGGKIGDKAFALKPGNKGLIKPKATHAGGGCQVTLSYEKGEKWKAFFDTRWSVNPRYRTLVFFYQEPESDKLGIVPIIEILK